MARKAIPPKKRFEVLKRDGFCCHYCGARPPAAILVVDHIVPVADGGTNDMENLITACATCNAGKGPVPILGSEMELSISLEELSAALQRCMSLLGKYLPDCLTESDMAEIAAIGAAAHEHSSWADRSV